MFYRQQNLFIEASRRSCSIGRIISNKYPMKSAALTDVLPVWNRVQVSLHRKQGQLFLLLLRLMHFNKPEHYVCSHRMTDYFLTAGLQGTTSVLYLLDNELRVHLCYDVVLRRFKTTVLFFFNIFLQFLNSIWKIIPVIIERPFRFTSQGGMKRKSCCLVLN